MGRQLSVIGAAKWGAACFTCIVGCIFPRDESPTILLTNGFNGFSSYCSRAVRLLLKALLAVLGQLPAAQAALSALSCPKGGLLLQMPLLSNYCFSRERSGQ